MKYYASWTQKDGTRITDQLYTASAISQLLENLESWGCTNIVIESISDSDKTN